MLANLMIAKGLRMMSVGSLPNRRPKTGIEQSILDVPPFGTSRPAVMGVLDRFLAVVVRIAQQHLTGNHAGLKVAVAATLLSLLVTFPVYEGMSQRLQNHITSQALLWKVQHPLSQVLPQLKNPSLYQREAAGEASHADKLELRLTLPILGWLVRHHRSAGDSE